MPKVRYSLRLQRLAIPMCAAIGKFSDKAKQKRHPCGGVSNTNNRNKAFILLNRYKKVFLLSSDFFCGGHVILLLVAVTKRHNADAA